MKLYDIIDKIFPWQLSVIVGITGVIVSLSVAYFLGLKNEARFFYMPVVIGMPLSYLFYGRLWHYKNLLKKSNRELTAARDSLAEYNQRVNDSIRYAALIQRSLLTDEDHVKGFLPRSFVLWMPRDQVSGDIYLAEETDDGFLICVIDCTGHGVPGAFLTMIASTALTRIIRDEELRDPSRILMRLNYTVKKTLRLDTEYSCSDDGMDAAVCAVHPDKNLLVFAGAKLPLIYIDNDEIRIVKGDRQSIGYKESKRSDIGFDFKTHEIRTEKGMSFYMATDGFADQLGGNNAEKFGNRRFRELLRTISKEPFDKRKDMLIRKFNEHKGNYERQDDVTVVGFSL